MTRTTRRGQAKPKVMTIGIFGLGEASPKAMSSLLDDYIRDAEAEFILPATRDHYTPAVSAIADYLAEHDIPFAVVTDDTTAKARTLRNLAKDASAEHKAAQPGVGIVNLLKDADDGRLILLWDPQLGEEDGGAYDALEYADENDIAVFDMCNGLEPMDFNDPDDEDDDKPAAKDEDTDDNDNEDEDDEMTHDETLPAFKEAVGMGIRQLRSMARDRKLASDRKIGGMSKDEVLDLLYGAQAPAAVQTTLEEQVAAAAHAVNGATTAAAPLAPAGGLVFMDVDDLAARIAVRVKELIDA